MMFPPSDLTRLIPGLIDEREREIRASVRARNLLRRTPTADRPRRVPVPSDGRP
jgi:hypothetical protein